MLRIGLVAGEASGDYLGAGLIRALREAAGEGEVLHFEGVTGPQMRAAGCDSLESIERLSLMGVTEVVSHLPSLFRLRGELIAHFERHTPDVFVGIDAPDFNLSLERKLHDRGMATVHYVSPTVWAWRAGRVRSIARAVTRVLALFPFEVDIYRQAGVDVSYVGHPLGDQIPLEVNAGGLRRQLGLAVDAPLVAVLPGSRMSEIRHLGAPFARTVAWLHRQRPELRFVAPMANERIRTQFEQALAQHAPGVPVTLVDGHSRECMGAADAVLLACGTAALEAMLLKRPMVVAYRIGWLTHALLKQLRLVRVKYYSLPNLLADACPDDNSACGDALSMPLVPEFIQAEVKPEAMGESILMILDDTDRRARLIKAFDRLHRLLRRDASRQAAHAVLQVARQTAAARGG